MRRAQISFSDHAVERFIERFAPELTPLQARAYLEEEGLRAVRLKTHTAMGQEQWELQEPRCILVVKNSYDIGRVCKTILIHQENFGGWTEDEMEILKEASERLPPIPVPEWKPPVKPAPKPSPPPPTVRQLAKFRPPPEAVELQRILTARANERDRAKTERHFNRMDETINKQKRCLRSAVRYLLAKAAEGDHLALQIAEQIQEVESGYLTEAFLENKKTG